mgnify:CR=1 FL=1
MNTTITWQTYDADELKYRKMVTDENYMVTVTDINKDLGDGFIMKKAPDSMPGASIVYEEI